MRIDLHTHTRASDGTQTAEELVRAAAASGLDVLGVTDHDTTEGWAEAARTAAEVGITLVRGIEVSTKHLGRGAHLLAYLPDPTYPPLLEHLRKILDGRSSRVPAMLERLREAGVDVDISDVRRAADGTAATGRPHVADALVTLGVVPDRSTAFRRFLNPGRPAYVNRYAAPLVEMIRVIDEAGGVSVLAHPWGRHGEESMPESALTELAGLGLAGLEVDHQDHPPAARERLRAIARDLDLVVTGSSDHHGLGKHDHELGCNTTAPEELERLLALADAASARSTRTTPEVLR
ncbi:PHP domain-containing protein [Nocardioides halotolerans]|uniref:PHP domain-containing protein n=1 Tax=Nocardioides halotolerans TaxID=433660 RepID=UPI00049014A2|nr:PHP domain-containing protein [Nocardioides halotolerans]